MQENITKILEDNSLLLKCFGCLWVISFWMLPGGLFLLVEKTSLYFQLNLGKLIFTSIILSMPFNIVGFVMVCFSILSKQKNSDAPVNYSVWIAVIFSYLWGCATVGILYFSTRFTSHLFTDFKTTYMVNYIFIAFLMFIALISKMQKDIKNANKSNQSDAQKARASV